MLKFVANLSAGLLKAFVLTKLWGWFVVPKFWLPSINFVEAYGLMLTASLFTYQLDASVHTDRIIRGLSWVKTRDHGVLALALVSLILSSCYLLSGYIWSLFI